MRMQTQPRTFHTRYIPHNLALGAFEGVAIIIYFLSLPVDPDTRTALIFPLTRWALILAALTGAIIFALLLLKWRRNPVIFHRAFSLITTKPANIPLLFLGLFILGLQIILFVTLFWPGLFDKINLSYFSRVGPFVIWAVLLALQLLILWLITWVSFTVRINSLTGDRAAVLSLFILSFVIRANMTGYALPYQSVWDEVVTYPQAMRMLVEPGLKPGSFVSGYGKAAYGDLLTYVTAGGEVIGLINSLRTNKIDSIADYVAPPQGARSIHSAVHPSGIPLQYPRLLLSFINSLMPVLVYLILRKCLDANVWAALAAGMLLAVLSRDVIYYSSYILPDALAVTLFTAMLLIVLTAMPAGRSVVMRWLAAGLVAGLILSVTIRLAVAILVPVLGFALARDHSRPWQKAGAIFAGAAAGFIATSPYAVLDLPGYLERIAGLAWYQDMYWPNRFSSFIYYIQGMFKPGFISGYVDSNTGSVGLGLLAGFLAVIGIGKLIWQHPRQAVVLILFTTFHLYVITGIIQNFTRHALVLYPIACIFAGAGLTLLAGGLNSLILWFAKRGRFSLKFTAPCRLMKAAPALLFLIFMLVSWQQLNQSVRYVNRMHNFQTSQELVAEYLNNLLQPGERVGILNLLPWVEQDLVDRQIAFERISIYDDQETLHGKGIRYIVSTDRINKPHNIILDAYLMSGFKAPGAKLVEFHTSPLEYEGYPAGALYMFIAVVP